MALEPQLIHGGVAVDDRGEVSFANDFSFAGIKRFYMVSNHSSGFVRAWHGHKKEGKYVLAVSGAALVGAVKVDNWDQPSPDSEVSKFVISAKKPALLHIPPGYANGFMSLSSDCKLMFYSTATLDESRNDDWRYDSRLWDIWNVEER